ncbi:MAG: DTW domain-containing protein [Desulfobulbaceae bacterium]|nr:DTW domain-containing protein [Desulfobulbaceae bacterium]
MKIYLLTHERELKKQTNSGRIVKECLGGRAEIVVWKRTEPNKELIDLIDHDEIALLYPEVKDGPEKSCPDFDNFLILDATWQEARKIYNRSPYLQKAPKVSLSINEPSRYKLRRNQIVAGLSTAECAIELLRQKDQTSLADGLSRKFDRFNTK